MSDQSYVDSYSIVRVIGYGDSGKVKLAIDSKNSQQVAIKFLRIQSNAQQMQRYFDREIRSLQQISHRNVIQLLEYSQNSTYHRKNNRGEYQCMYIVMEYCQNGELWEILNGLRGITEKTIRYYFKGIIQGLTAAHLQGFSHGDIKFENILIDDQFNVKLCDFGHSQLNQQSSFGLFESHRKGPFVAPEVISSQCHNPQVADIFSVGVILLTMACGNNKPFILASPSDFNFLNLQQRNHMFWRNVQKYAQFKFTSEFQNLINQLLSIDPQDRPTLSELTLDSWVNQEVASVNEIQQQVQTFRENNPIIMPKKTNKQKPPEFFQAANLFRDADFSLSSSGEEFTMFCPQQYPGGPYKYCSIISSMPLYHLLGYTVNVLENLKADYTINNDKGEIKSNVITDWSQIAIRIKIFTYQTKLYRIEFTKESGSSLMLKEIFDKLHEEITNTDS